MLQGAHTIMKRLFSGQTFGGVVKSKPDILHALEETVGWGALCAWNTEYSVSFSFPLDCCLPRLPPGDGKDMLYYWFNLDMQLGQDRRDLALVTPRRFQDLLRPRKSSRSRP